MPSLGFGKIINTFLHCGLTTSPSFLSYQDPNWKIAEVEAALFNMKMARRFQLANFCQAEPFFLTELFGIFV